MRLTELTLENYGNCASREISIPDGPGLTVIYGPNEAGKSTCLEAISDFLFSIPKNTQRGSLFGYDGMRLGASMQLSDSTTLTFKRRKGSGKTLSDASGTALDDAALAPILGTVLLSFPFQLDAGAVRQQVTALWHYAGKAVAPAVNRPVAIQYLTRLADRSVA